MVAAEEYGFMKDLDGRGLMAESGLDYFKSASTFGALSDEAIRYLLSHGQVYAVESGEPIFTEGERGDFFVVVLQGKVGYYRESEGRRVLIREVTFGQEVGYVSMIGLFCRQGSVSALEPSILLRISTDLFYQLHIDYPSDFGILMLNLSRELARTISGINDKLVEVSLHPKSD